MTRKVVGHKRIHEGVGTSPTLGEISPDGKHLIATFHGDCSHSRDDQGLHIHGADDSDGENAPLATFHEGSETNHKFEAIRDAQGLHVFRMGKDAMPKVHDKPIRSVGDFARAADTLWSKQSADCGCAPVTRSEVKSITDLQRAADALWQK
jgi:hypothetical protein